MSIQVPVVEIATPGSGLDADEPLGTRLQLPAWIETHHERIEASLDSIALPEAAAR